MNSKQKEAFEAAINGHNYNLLLIGAAGTGKSFVINEISKSLRTKGKNVKITCSTGIACNVYNSRGNVACTIHQFTGISDGRHEPRDIVNVLTNNRKYDAVVKQIKELDVLIVDECSMISKRVFETIKEVCSIKSPTAEFGGIQVIFCGDFFQLPPVPNPSYGDHGEYCFQSEFFNSVFPHKIVLDENVRQNEPELINSIKEVYSGRLSRETEEFILSLRRPLTIPTDETKTLKLFSKNDLADDFNRKNLIGFNGRMYEFRSTDEGKVSELSSIQAQHNLWLKVGCPVILLRNLTDRLVNGLQGYLKEISDDGSPIVDFPSVNVTTKIPKVKFTVFSPTLNMDIATREQYPLKAAFGLTIHKAQGMTLASVEIDCREIFKPGQLGVAMSRARTAAAIRVINFHPRYVIPPPEVVTEFMMEPSKPLIDDVTCCWKSVSAPTSKEITPSCNIPVSEDSSTGDDPQPSGDIGEDEDFDTDFDNVISTIMADELETTNFELPQEFKIEEVMHGMIFEKEVTDHHTCINGIIKRLETQPARLLTFIKKIFLNFANFVTNLIGNQKTGTGIPEKAIAQYYQLVHEFCISPEYRMDCLMLFESEEVFTDNHMIVCFNIIEQIRLFYLKQKVDLLKIKGSGIVKRHITNASRARIRYVAGYCLASLRKKYSKQVKNNMFASSAQAQDNYLNSNHIIQILNLLKEDENYLRSHTDEPESLVDIDRRQYASRGLINVTDSLFKFFVCLTDKYLGLLVHENLMKYGKDLYEQCLKAVLGDKDLFEQFLKVVITSYRKESIQYFEEQSNIEVILDDMVMLTSQIDKIFQELLKKYLMVLLAQFRKDVKSSYRVEKTMAHRKQIKISKQKQDQKKGDTVKAVKTKKVSKQYKSVESEASNEPIAGPSNQPMPGPSTQQMTRPMTEPSNEPIAGPSNQPMPGPSTQQMTRPMTTEPIAGPSKEPGSEHSEPEDTSDLCQVCFVDKEDDFILCDSCENWFHRKCAGLKNSKLWKRVSSEGAQWFCKSCV